MIAAAAGNDVATFAQDVNWATQIGQRLHERYGAGVLRPFIHLGVTGATFCQWHADTHCQGPDRTFYDEEPGSRSRPRSLQALRLICAIEATNDQLAAAIQAIETTGRLPRCYAGVTFGRPQPNFPALTRKLTAWLNTASPLLTGHRVVHVACPDDRLDQLPIRLVAKLDYNVGRGLMAALTEPHLPLEDSHVGPWLRAEQLRRVP